MATISSLGVGSGLDLSGLLDKLDSAERLKLQPLTTQKTEQQSRLSAYGRLGSALTKLQTAAKALGDAATFQAVTSTISGSGVTAAAKSDAVVGSYTVKVDTLAQAQSLATTGVADQQADLGSGTLTISQGSGSAQKTLTVNLAATASSLEDVRDAINSQGGGVTASIVNDGDATAPYRLVLSSTSTGTDAQMTVGFSGTGQLGSLLGYAYDSAGVGSGAMSETVAASNAKLEVNGITIQRQSNVAEDVVQGVTLSLSEAGASHVLTVARDSASIKSSVSGFVDAYNSLQSTISSLTAYDSETKTAGDLLGDATLRNVQTQLRGVLTGALSGGSLARLSDAGVELQLGGKLQIDDEKLGKLVDGDLSALSTFFAGSSSGDGLGDKLGSTLDSILGSGGILASATDGIKAQVKSIDQRYARMDDSITATIERYRKQFSQLDSMLTQMNATTTYLTQQFNALNAQLKG